MHDTAGGAASGDANCSVDVRWTIHTGIYEAWHHHLLMKHPMRNLPLVSQKQEALSLPRVGFDFEAHEAGKWTKLPDLTLGTNHGKPAGGTDKHTFRCRNVKDGQKDEKFMPCKGVLVSQKNADGKWEAMESVHCSNCHTTEPVAKATEKTKDKCKPLSSKTRLPAKGTNKAACKCDPKFITTTILMVMVLIWHIPIVQFALGELASRKKSTTNKVKMIPKGDDYWKLHVFKLGSEDDDDTGFWFCLHILKEADKSYWHVHRLPHCTLVYDESRDMTDVFKLMSAGNVNTPCRCANFDNFPGKALKDLMRSD